MKYSNPVISGFYPDPSVCRVGEDYYLVTSSFEYFPGVPIFHSRDLVNWRQIGHCLTRASQLPLEGSESSQGIYAPTIRHHNGRFYMITTNMTIQRNFFVWADKPEGPWSEPVWIDWEGIDTSLHFDESGKVYVTGTSKFGLHSDIHQAEINIETGGLLTERRLIWEGTGGAYPEAPHLYAINGKYYLVLAEGGTEFGHMATIARSDHPYGPFESCPHNPILSHRSRYSNIHATGHVDFVQTPDGSWWAVFLGIRTLSYPHYHHLGRETFLAPVTWSEDGWPIIGDNGRVELEMDAGTLPLEEGQPWRVRKDFQADKLDDAWNFLRNPHPEDWSLTERPGWLTLHGSAVTLNDLDSPAFVGHRHGHFDCSVSTLLEFAPTREGEEAGLTVLMNERFHYEIAVTRLDGVQKVIFRRRLGTLWKVEQEIEYNGSGIVLSVQANPKAYTFAYAAPGGEAKVLGSGECGMLSSEVAGGFTGVYFGLYATGNGQACAAPAYFNGFDYDPTPKNKA
jgi:alpha-N-arabinofuranosidase